MSIVPTDNPFSGNLFGAPKDAFEYLLDAIIATVPSKREALVKPHLQVFTAHPVIKELISQGKTPAPTEDIPPANLELKQIQNTLCHDSPPCLVFNTRSASPVPSALLICLI